MSVVVMTSNAVEWMATLTMDAGEGRIVAVVGLRMEKTAVVASQERMTGLVRRIDAVLGVVTPDGIEKVGKNFRWVTLFRARQATDPGMGVMIVAMTHTGSDHQGDPSDASHPLLVAVRELDLPCHLETQ